jgi:hypothetical protein
MDNLVNSSFFVANRTVAQLSENSVRLNLETFIKRFQYDYLTRVMGLTLYKLFEAEYTGGPIPQKWKDLVDGAEFDYKGAVCVWPGLANQTFKTSPIADYVYYHYHRDQATTVVGSGTMVPNVENGEVVVNRGRMVDAWNAARKGAQLLEMFLQSRPDDYPNYDGVSEENRQYFTAINILNL